LENKDGKMIRFKPTFEFEDEKGILREVIRRDNFKQMNEAIRHKGQSSGHHYHKVDEELFYIISGRMNVEITNIKTKEKTEFTAGPKEGFIVEPNEVHSFFYPEDTILIAMHSLPFDKDNPDIHEYNPETD
jgi:dTDP-4-dehydrorhamnose 3,5-epimerase-like enzyme